MGSSGAQEMPSLISDWPQLLNRTSSKCAESRCLPLTREGQQCKDGNDTFLLPKEDKNASCPPELPQPNCSRGRERGTEEQAKTAISVL